MNSHWIALLIAITLLGVACSSTQPEPAYIRNDITLPMAQVRNAWFKELDRANPQLHDVLLVALAESRRSDREVFILKRTLGEGENASTLYTASLERGGSDNLMSVNYSTREFMFDHFGESDGPTLEETRNRLYNEERIRIIKHDLGIFGIK
jgi:hypothetical protein